ncbi:MAG: DNA protection during starvation protein, partial [uncultured Rubrobacteraceae bacterium]
AAAWAADGRGARNKGSNRRRDQGNRALHAHSRGNRGVRPSNAGHGDSDTSGRAGAPPPLRGLFARVRGRRAGV